MKNVLPTWRTKRQRTPRNPLENAMRELRAGEWGDEMLRAYADVLKHILETDGDLWTFAQQTEQQARDLDANDWPQSAAQLRAVADIARAIHERRAISREFAERLGDALGDWMKRALSHQEPTP